MSRPCKNDHDLRCIPGESFTPDRDCRLCWLYTHDASYQALWDRQPIPADTRSEPPTPTVLPPSLLTRLGTFAKAIIRHTANGWKNVSEVDYEQRLAICKGEQGHPSCPHYLSSYEGGRCGKCGCGMAGTVVAKALWESETCPLGKWPAPTSTPSPTSEPPAA